MALWVVRAGAYGDQQETALNEKVVCHGWNSVPDCSKFTSKDELRQEWQKLWPEDSEKQIITI